MAQIQTVARIKRVRLGGKIVQQPNKVLPDDDKKMRQLLQSIANADLEAAKAAQRRTDAVAELFKLMKTYRIPSLEIDAAIAQIVTPKGKSTSYIDPRLFRDRVEDEDFVKAVRVSITEAKKILSGKELDEITDVKPGKNHPPELQVMLKGLPD